jgi:hypothetical protein
MSQSSLDLRDLATSIRQENNEQAVVISIIERLGVPGPGIGGSGKSGRLGIS